MSVGLIARLLGVDPSLANLAPWLVLALGSAAIVLFRDRPALSWSVAVIVMVFGFGAVHIHTFALLLALAAPMAWPQRHPDRAVETAPLEAVVPGSAT